MKRKYGKGGGGNRPQVRGGDPLPESRERSDHDAPPPEPPIKFVACLGCEHEQGDMGRNVACEECGRGPMPYYDKDGELIE